MPLKEQMQEGAAHGWQNFKAYARRRPGVVASAALHLALILAIAGAFSFFSKPKLPESKPIAVDIVPVKEKTQITPQKQAEPAKPKEKPEAPPKSPVRKVYSKPKPPPEPKPVPKAVEKPETPTVAAKPKEKPKPKAEPKPEQPDFTSVLKTVKELESTRKERKPEQQAINPNVEMSITMRDKLISTIRRQVEAHWNIPAGARSAGDMKIQLEISLNRDGTVTNVEIADRSRYSSDPIFRASADSAIRAVKKASPIQDLPVRYYEDWKDTDMIFDPSKMI